MNACTNNQKNAARLRVALLTVSALALGGCLSPRVSGHFGAEAYYHTHDHYRVRYGAHDASLLEEPWRLTNFEADEAGRPTHHDEDPSQLVSFDLGRYGGSRYAQVLSAARYDLYFERAGRSSEIFVRTIPLRAPWTGDSLPTLMQRSVASMASLNADGPDLLGRPVAAGESQVLPVAQGSARVDGRDAYFITFDLHRPLHEGGSTDERITLVGVRAEEVPMARRVSVPVLLLFAHTSAIPEHEEEQETFASLVRRVDLVAAR